MTESSSKRMLQNHALHYQQQHRTLGVRRTMLVSFSLVDRRANPLSQMMRLPSGPTKLLDSNSSMQTMFGKRPGRSHLLVSYPKRKARSAPLLRPAGQHSDVRQRLSLHHDLLHPISLCNETCEVVHHAHHQDRLRSLSLVESLQRLSYPFSHLPRGPAWAVTSQPTVPTSPIKSLQARALCTVRHGAKSACRLQLSALSR